MTFDTVDPGTPDDSVQRAEQRRQDAITCERACGDAETLCAERLLITAPSHHFGVSILLLPGWPADSAAPGSFGSPRGPRGAPRSHRSL